jgi:hypothetical protein
MNNKYDKDSKSVNLEHRDTYEDELRFTSNTRECKTSNDFILHVRPK